MGSDGTSWSWTFRSGSQRPKEDSDQLIVGRRKALCKKEGFFVIYLMHDEVF